MRHIKNSFVVELSEQEVHTVIESLMYAQSMTQEYLDSEDTGITVEENRRRVNTLMDGLMDLIAVEI